MMKIKKEFASTILMTLILASMLLVHLPAVLADDHHVSVHSMPPDTDDFNATCVMKATASGNLYVPSLAVTAMKIEFLFNSYLVGDQTGGISPYPNIANWPDGTVDLYDAMLISACYGSNQGESSWNYMADIVADKTIDIFDAVQVSNNYGHSGVYNMNLTGVTVTFNTGSQVEPNYGGYVLIPQLASSFTVRRNGIPTGAMVVFGNGTISPLAFSTTFKMSIPSAHWLDDGQRVWYYVMARIYAPNPSGEKVYFVANLTKYGSAINSVRINGMQMSGQVSPPINVSLGTIRGYNLLEFEFLDVCGGSGSMNFTVMTQSLAVMQFARFRMYVPGFSTVYYGYAIDTFTSFPHDHYYLGGYADKYINDTWIDTMQLWPDWEWNTGIYGSIYGWGDGFMYPLGELDSTHTMKFTYWNNENGTLDFKYISQSNQPSKIGPPKFYASAKIDKGPNITLNNASIYAGSRWASDPGDSQRNFTTLTKYNVSYSNGNDWFKTLLEVEMGNWWATWELGGSQPPDMAIPLNFTVANFTSNLQSHADPWGEPPLIYVWDVYLRNYTIDAYSFENLQIQGIEEAGAGQSNGIIAPGYTIALDFSGTTVMTLAAFIGESSVIPGIGAVVGLTVIGVAAALEYEQGQSVSAYSQTITENNHGQLTADEPIHFAWVDTNPSPQSKSELVFLKFQPTTGFHCGLTKVVMRGTLAACYDAYAWGGLVLADRRDFPIGDIEITLCIPWFIWSQT